MTDTADVAVIGAGVVGLAIARELALAGREVVVLEKNRGIGEETSSRSSEVIHAGLYYAGGSLKARLCVEGNRKLYEYCAAKGVDHRRCGKLIVASNESVAPKLDAIRRSARDGGVSLAPVDAAEIRELEPEVRGVAGLWSESTGIVDSHALLLALRGDLEAAGGHVALLARCTAGAREGDSARLAYDVEGSVGELRARAVVNAAGLHAIDVARALALPGPPLPTPRYAKGNYFRYNGQSPFEHLVYPVPEDGGLGIHATLDLAGRARFGPNVEWLPPATRAAELRYDVDVRFQAVFAEAIRTYWPGLPDGALEPAYAGVRPKINGPGEPAGDFAVRALRERGWPRVVQLFGIESPGLTSALALGRFVAELVTAE